MRPVRWLGDTAGRTVNRGGENGTRGTRESRGGESATRGAIWLSVCLLLCRSASGGESTLARQLMVLLLDEINEEKARATCRRSE
jgi:hypothetical protein